MSEIRAFFLDSKWTERNNDGSFSLILGEQIEVPNGSVAYFDDLSVIGSIPMCNVSNNKIYVVEKPHEPSILRNLCRRKPQFPQPQPSL